MTPDATITSSLFPRSQPSSWYITLPLKVHLQPEQLLKDTVSMHNEPQHSIPNFTENIPGEPIADYPVHTKLQNIRFSCIGRTPGHYYADPSQDCQVRRFNCNLCK